MRHNRSVHTMLAIVVTAVALYVACGGSDMEPLPPCISVSDCPESHRCINNVCVPPGVDAGNGTMDAGNGGTDAGEDPEDAHVPTDAPTSGTE